MIFIIIIILVIYITLQAHITKVILMENHKCQSCLVQKLKSFKVLEDKELTGIFKHKTAVSFKKGEHIFEEGEKLNGVYCIMSGICKLSKMSDNGRDLILRLATDHELLGQRSVIADEKTNLSAVALSDVKACYVSKSYLSSLIDHNCTFTKTVLQETMEQLKAAEKLAVTLSQKSAKQRISQVILYLQEKFGKDTEGYISFQLSRLDISNMAGTAIESCIRILANLKKNKFIDTSGKKIKILEQKALAVYC